MLEGIEMKKDKSAYWGELDFSLASNLFLLEETIEDRKEWAYQFFMTLAKRTGSNEYALKILADAQDKLNRKIESGRKGGLKSAEIRAISPSTTQAPLEGNSSTTQAPLEGNSSTTQQNRIEQNRVEQNRVEQNRIDKIRVEENTIRSSDEELKKAVKEKTSECYKEFEELWEAYPKRKTESGHLVKVGKQDAWQAFRKLSKAKQQKALESVGLYAQASDGYPKDCKRYLTGELWEGLELQEKKKEPSTFEEYWNAD